MVSPIVQCYIISLYDYVITTVSLSSVCRCRFWMNSRRLRNSKSLRPSRYTYTCLCIYIYTYIYIYIYIYIYMYIYICVCMRVCTYLYVCIYSIYIDVCINIKLHKCIYIHFFICIHICIFVCVRKQISPILEVRDTETLRQFEQENTEARQRDSKCRQRSHGTCRSIMFTCVLCGVQRFVNGSTSTM